MLVEHFRYFGTNSCYSSTWRQLLLESPLDFSDQDSVAVCLQTEVLGGQREKDE